MENNKHRYYVDVPGLFFFATQKKFSKELPAIFLIGSRFLGEKLFTDGEICFFFFCQTAHSTAEKLIRSGFKTLGPANPSDHWYIWNTLTPILLDINIL